MARGGLGVLRDVDDRDAHQLADLRSGDADAVPEVAHRVEQVLDHGRRFVRGDGRRRLREQRVRVQQDVADQRTSGSTGRRVILTSCSAATACRRSSRSAAPGGTATSMIIT